MDFKIYSESEYHNKRNESVIAILIYHYENDLPKVIENYASELRIQCNTEKLAVCDDFLNCITPEQLDLVAYDIIESGYPVFIFTDCKDHDRLRSLILNQIKLRKSRNIA